MDDLTKARTLLNTENYTCVLCKDGQLFTSRHRGVRPLMDLLGQEIQGFSAADKVVGRATALLYCLLGIKELYATVISESALDILNSHCIPVQWEQKVPGIINREGTGPCPMELATREITDPAQAPEAIRQKLAQLQAQ